MLILIVIVTRVVQRIRTWIKTSYVYIKIYFYAQWYIVRKLVVQSANKEAKVRPWTQVAKYLDDEWVGLLHEDIGILRPVTRQPSINPNSVVQGPLTQFHTALSVHDRLRTRLEQEKGTNPERWATPEVKALLEEAVAEAILGLEGLKDAFPLKGAAYFNADFLEFVKGHIGKQVPDDEDLRILKTHIESLLYIEAIQVFIKLHKEQSEKYKNLLKCYARIFVELKKENYELSEQLRSANLTIKETWGHLETKIQKAVQRHEHLIWYRLDYHKHTYEELKRQTERQLESATAELKELRRKFFEGQNTNVNRVRQLQLELANLQRIVRPLKDQEKVALTSEEIEIHAPSWDAELDEPHEVLEPEPPAKEVKSKNTQPAQETKEQQTTQKEPCGIGAVCKPVTTTSVKLPEPIKPPLTHVRSPEARKRRREKYRNVKIMRPVKGGENQEIQWTGEIPNWD